MTEMNLAQKLRESNNSVELCDYQFLVDKSLEIVDEVLIPRVAAKMCELLRDAVPDYTETVSPESICIFLEFLRSKIGLRIGESVVACLLLMKFISKQRAKSKHALTKKNIGTILVCLIIITLKLCRDRVYKNIFFTKTFGLNIQILNESEVSFLRMIDYECNIQKGEYWNIFGYLMN
ncbi:MAG: hypothetical protein EZS28_018350 [Streblomastix strix]|uniref:Cyclin N-terminal domain-containing protein n=1 Tax=Streblomastix strix TaxID=222440 RepID=A0A5J4VUT0_9EUKA|nr:MAG: hypothetical protein EZS28_018350 [Streblomastix strix]